MFNRTFFSLKGRTALHVAASQRTMIPEIIQLLVDSGCNWEEQDKEVKLFFLFFLNYQNIILNILLFV